MSHLERLTALELIQSIREGARQVFEIDGKRFVVSIQPVSEEDEDEASRLLAERYIEANPDIKQDIEKSRKAFEEGRFYTLDQIIDQVERGER